MINDTSTVPVLDLAQCFVLVFDAVVVAQPGVVLVCAMLVAPRVVRFATRPREHHVACVRAVSVLPHPSLSASEISTQYMLYRLK